jgi:hypothetical protein
MNTTSFHSDIEKKIHEIQGNLQKRDTLIGGLKKIFEADEIILTGEDDGHLVASVQELKDFSVEIGRLLKVTGDVDLTAYKNKAREIMDGEIRQKATITQLESEVAHFKAVVQEKEGNISDLQAVNTSLKSMEGMSEDSLQKSAQEAEAKALTYQQQFAGGVRGELKEQLKDFQNLMMTQNIEQMRNLGKAIRATEAGESAVKGNISAENTETTTAAPSKDLFIPAGGDDTIISGDFGAFTLDKRDDIMAAPGIRNAISNTNSGNGDMMKFAAAIVAAIQQQTNILSRSDSGYRQGINDYFN